MKIMVPLSPAYSIDELVSVGADAFYLGYIPIKWLDLFGNSIFVNRRGRNIKANFTDENIDNAISRCHFYKKPVFITFNSHQYSKEELNVIYSSISYLAKLNIDGIIASDILVLKFCQENGIKTILSTCATNYNRYSCDFYLSFGVNHIIFPRDISILEMSDIIKQYPGVEWEAFIYNSACRFSESVCLSNHGLYGNICKRVRNMEQYSINKGIPSQTKDIYCNKLSGACGLCEIFNMDKAGIDWLKIVERSLPYEEIKKSCLMVKNSINYIKRSKTDEDFRQHIIRMMQCNGPSGLCYYK